MQRRDSAEKDRQRRPQSAKNSVLRYRPATYEPAVEEAEEEPQQPATLKLKKRLPSANNTREATRKNLLLKQQVSQQSEPNDFARLLPKNIYQDKEFLYSELLQVKQQYNSAAQQVTRLRTRVAALEKEKARMQKVAEESQPRSTHLRLKMAVGEVMGAKPHHQHPQSIKYLRLENDKLRRMVKCTDIQELQAENNALYEELDRLKQLLQKQITAGLNSMIITEQSRGTEEKLLNENAKLRQQLKQPSDKPNNHKNQVGESEKKLQAQVRILREEIDVMKQDNQYQATTVIKEELARLQRELLVEKTVVKGLTEKLAYLESKEKLSTEVSLNGLPTRSSSAYNSQQQTSTADSISSEQLVQLGQFLSFKFMAQRYSRSDVERSIGKVQQYNNHALNNILLGEPFFMNNQHHRKLFVERVTDSGKRQPTKQLINRVIDEIVPEYALLNNEQEEELYVGCSELITLNYNSLEQDIKAHENSTGVLSKEHLTEVLSKVGFSHQQICFTIGEISFFSDDLASLNCYAMFDKFYIPTENLEPTNSRYNLQHSYIEEVEEQFEESTPYNPTVHEYI